MKSKYQLYGKNEKIFAIRTPFGCHEKPVQIGDNYKGINSVGKMRLQPQQTHPNKQTTITTRCEKVFPTILHSISITKCNRLCAKKRLMQKEFCFPFKNFKTFWLNKHLCMNKGEEEGRRYKTFILPQWNYFKLLFLHIN